jgi:hypothetical protein
MEKQQGWESIRITAGDVARGVGDVALKTALFVTDRLGITNSTPPPYSLSDHCPDRLRGLRVGQEPTDGEAMEPMQGVLPLDTDRPDVIHYVRMAAQARREREELGE